MNAADQTQASTAADRDAFVASFSARGVSVSRGGRRILEDISLTLKPGEICILRGPNGAGKTTMLRAFAGLLRHEAGEIGFRDADGGEIQDIARVRVYCGPLNAVKPALTVDENLKFWARLYRRDSQRLEAARDAFDLGAYASFPARALSTGYQRRLGLARLVIAERPVWFVDEPTASIDAASMRMFEELASRHSRRGGVALIATHDEIRLPEAKTLQLESRTAAP
ncbi:MAG: heme ABC exporter ATP-binding protein CcmA [Parvularculaceae bacterium]